MIYVSPGQGLVITLSYAAPLRGGVASRLAGGDLSREKITLRHDEVGTQTDITLCSIRRSEAYSSPVTLCDVVEVHPLGC